MSSSWVCGLLWCSSLNERKGSYIVTHFTWIVTCDTVATLTAWTSPFWSIGVVWKSLLGLFVCLLLIMCMCYPECECWFLWTPEALGSTEAVGSHLSRVLVTEFRSSATIVCLLNHWTSSPPSAESLFTLHFSSLFENCSLSGVWMRLVMDWVENLASDMRSI